APSPVHGGLTSRHRSSPSEPQTCEQPQVWSRIREVGQPSAPEATMRSTSALAGDLASTHDLRRFDTATIIATHSRDESVALSMWLGFPPRFPGRAKICPATSQIQAQAGRCGDGRVFRPALIRTGLLFLRHPVHAPEQRAPAAGLRGLFPAEFWTVQS